MKNVVDEFSEREKTEKCFIFKENDAFEYFSIVPEFSEPIYIFTPLLEEETITRLLTQDLLNRKQGHRIVEQAASAEQPEGGELVKT